MKSTLNIIPMSIYVNNNSMPNILSLMELANSFRVTMDTKEDYSMLLNFKRYKAHCFKECENGLN